jgi:TrmH family RNA methyltransferase
VRVISSTKNPKVAAALRLRKRAFRDDDRRFLVEGAQGVREALDRAPPAVDTLFVADELHELTVRARSVGVDVVVATEPVLARLADTVTPQGLIGVAPFLDVAIDEVPAGCVAVLHDVRDPGNAGTIVRSADASGTDGVVFAGSSVDPYNPKTVRACAGSIFHLPVVRGLSTREAIDHLRGRGHRILAMDARGSESLYVTDVSGPVAFVFGNEAHGRDGARAACGASGIAEPRGGRNGVPVRPGAPGRGQGGDPRVPDRGRRARYPLTAHGDEGVRVRAREAMVGHVRRAACAHADRHRP